ncbi:3-phosphoshikimate 1-carboxyvinyltransferase [Helicobacter pametensis]|uniref:3-phosphoshikimate 1-carboxyvinyltransferase n=1 Tax=Helicobacter pametensis TaxID=95149 RepID=UPI0004B46AA3|nr:3-phosphoshikimate 1-carboxyvinyltransferase [Helicobacter pametensis]
MILCPKIDVPKQLEFDWVAPDKSLSHRSLIFAFLTQGVSEIENLLDSQDVRSTLEIAQLLGAKIEQRGERLLISPPHKLPAQAYLQCNNSGTTMRLFAGLLSGSRGSFTFDGDMSLRRRPMQRIRDPLEQMGALLSSSNAPFVLEGSETLRGICFHSSIASAQIKSAFILAALQANCESRYSEEELSRDHSERFLSHLGAQIIQHDKEILISPLSHPLPSYHFKIPNDPSSVIYLIVACLISHQMEIRISEVLLNPTRIQAFEILKQMGAYLSYEITLDGVEPIGVVYARSSELQAIEISSSISWLIDEIPALCIALACAKGVSYIYNAQELRFKESDRIASIVSNLLALGIEAEELEDGIKIHGGEFCDGVVQSFGDHRIAMSFALAGVRNQVEIVGSECIDISFPRFFDFLKFFVSYKGWK